MQDINLEYNKIKLKFADSDVERDFRSEAIEELMKPFRVGSLLGIFIYCSFLYFDVVEESQNLFVLTLNRIAVALVVLTAFGLSFTSLFKKYYFKIITFLFLFVGVATMHAMSDVVYLSSIYSVVIFFSLIPFLTLTNVILSNSILLLLYFSRLVSFDELSYDDVLKKELMLLSAMVVTIMVFYIKQRIERENYVKKQKNKKANELINKQYEELELVHKDITDSIRYAKRIQDALFPSELKLKVLPIAIELYYKPKDTIGGDFYWVEDLEDNIVVAIGDCTGHGVPGALMTSLGINGLINAVTERRMTEPSKILNYLDEYIYELLSVSDSNRIKDGMEIGILVLNRKNNTVAYSNAGRPLVYIDNDTIKKVKATRRDIGSKMEHIPFVTEIIQASDTATYYLFSDGMTDQFGGERKKRIGTKKFEQLLLSIASLPLKHQKKRIELFYKEYSKSTAQTDDMIWAAIQTRK